MDYVNMETNTCFFGYGGVAVKTFFQRLILSGIRPPMGVGTQITDKDLNKIGDWEYTGKNLFITFKNMDEVHDICNKLDIIEINKGGSFEFKGVVFDFMNYDPESVRVLRKKLEKVEKGILFSVAC